MAQNGTIALNFTIGGNVFTATETRTAEGVIGHNIVVPAGSAGAMNGSTVVDGLPTGHGLIATDLIDMHWDDPTSGAHKVRRGIAVDTANANDIVFDETPTPEGDTLPVTTTPVVLSKQIVVDTDFSGDLIEIVAMKADIKSMVDVRTSSASKQAQKLAAKASWFFITNWGYTNPFASSTIDVVRITNGGTVAGTVFVSILYQSVS